MKCWRWWSSSTTATQSAIRFLMERLEQTFADAVSDDPILEGFVLTEDGKTVGFAYITEYYACEVGGRCLMFEELLPEGGDSRGKGYGTRFFDEIMKAKPEVRRFRLEVTRSNEKAVRLYERLGFDLPGL